MSSSSQPSTSANPDTKSSSLRQVPISVHGDRAYVFDSTDVLHLRIAHRILGMLTGSLPLLPQQNAYLGLPLQLMPEEVKLLLDRGVAQLIDDQAAHRDGIMSKDEWDQWQQERQRRIDEERLDNWKRQEDHKKRFEEALKKGTQGKSKAKGKAAAAATVTSVDAEKARQVEEKRQARAEEKKRRQQHQEAEGYEVEQEAETSATQQAQDTSTEAPETSEVAAPPDLSNYSYTHLTADAATGLPWYDPSTSSNEALSTPFSPSTPLSQTRQHLFHHLNNKGYYLSCGLRFGGDFVLYPGDPFRYHSHFTMTVVEDEESRISCGKLIADGRLGTAVKKVHLIGTVRRGEEEEGERGVDMAKDDGEESKAQGSSPAKDGNVAFYSLTWAGFGT